MLVLKCTITELKFKSGGDDGKFVYLLDTDKVFSYNENHFWQVELGMGNNSFQKRVDRKVLVASAIKQDFIPDIPWKISNQGSGKISSNCRVKTYSLIAKLTNDESVMLSLQHGNLDVFRKTKL